MVNQHEREVDYFEIDKGKDKRKRIVPRERKQVVKAQEIESHIERKPVEQAQSEKL